MFKSTFQAGSFVEVFSSHGTNPTAECKLTASRIKKIFDQKTRMFVLCLNGNTISTKLQFPKDLKKGLGLTQPYLVSQVFIPHHGDFALEIGVICVKKNRRRVLISTVQKASQTSTLLSILPFFPRRNTWLHLCIDLPDLITGFWKEEAYYSIDSLIFSGSCQIRRIYTLNEQLLNSCQNNEIWEKTYFAFLPQQFQLPTVIPQSIQLISVASLLHPKQPVHVHQLFTKRINFTEDKEETEKIGKVTKCSRDTNLAFSCPPLTVKSIPIIKLLPKENSKYKKMPKSDAAIREKKEKSALSTSKSSGDSEANYDLLIEEEDEEDSAIMPSSSFYNKSSQMMFPEHVWDGRELTIVGQKAPIHEVTFEEYNKLKNTGKEAAVEVWLHPQTQSTESYVNMELKTSLENKIGFVKLKEKPSQKNIDFGVMSVGVEQEENRQPCDAKLVHLEDATEQYESTLIKAMQEDEESSNFCFGENNVFYEHIPKEDPEDEDALMIHHEPKSTHEEMVETAPPVLSDPLNTTDPSEWARSNSPPLVLLNHIDEKNFENSKCEQSVEHKCNEKKESGLLFDPQLNCFYQPHSGKYYKIA